MRLLRTFPSHHSICKQHVIPAVQPLNVVFSCFLIFVMISLIVNTVARVLLYHVDWCIYQNNICFLKIVVNGFQVAGKAQLYIFIFLMHLYPSISGAEAGKAYRWRGTPVPCVCWYINLQISSQTNIVSRPHTLPMSVWYDFHWHHRLRNRCMKPCVVAMQKTVPLCCDLYQMHHIFTCSLATGDTVCWS